MVLRYAPLCANLNNMLTPDKESFLKAAKTSNLIPVYREAIADMVTPISAYRKFDGASHRFLLESAENAEVFGRYSFVGADPAKIFTFRDGEVLLREFSGTERRESTRQWEAEGDPLQELQKLMEDYRPAHCDGLPLFYGGAVGFLAYEAVRYFEPTVPTANNNDLDIPDALFIVTRSLLIFDHHKRKIQIVANVEVGEDPEAAYDEACSVIDQLTGILSTGIENTGLAPVDTDQQLESQPNMTREEYITMTSRMQEYIRAGDIFQVVPSQRFAVPYQRSALDLYRVLRFINPSPYMFCLELDDLALVGSSPETHVRCEEGQVEVHPIAGTRPRREDPQEDVEMERDLLADPKERAEHVMLVDLGRNDVGRVCEYDTVEVTDFMEIERYSHVMHIVSHVVGCLRPGLTAYDVLRATFPAGTVSGAPKVRAMQIIAEGEPTNRGVYSGAVGYFGFSGNLDCCIAIRTVVIKGGQAYVQAGGGLVADSTPEGEFAESVNKAKAAIRALALSRELP
jgi:anthranilate synthase component 1